MADQTPPTTTAGRFFAAQNRAIRENQKWQAEHTGEDNPPPEPEPRPPASP